MTQNANAMTIDNTSAAPVFDGNTVVDGAYKVTVNKGSNIGRVSSEWSSRPADQRFLSLNDLHAETKASFLASREFRAESNQLRMVADFNDSEKMEIQAGENGEAMAISHWTFGQLCGLGTPTSPAGYLRNLPAPIAAINLQHCLQYRGEQVKLYSTTWKGDETKTQLRAVTGPDYGRIPDYKLVEAIQRIAGNGTGDTHWKIPGVLNWRTMHYNPFVEPTTENTTLYASDRDVFCFLVDDTRPIEVGKLPDGSPDLMFRGFYAWNSEVGGKSMGVATMYLRACCMNRNLWGVEGFQEITLRHTKNAPLYFDREVKPALETYAQRSDRTLINGVQAAKAAIVAKNDEEAVEFLQGTAKLSKPMALKVVETVTREEQTAPRSIWDMVQGMTAVARQNQHQDARLDMEKNAGKLLNKVTKSAA